MRRNTYKKQSQVKGSKSLPQSLGGRQLCKTVLDKERARPKPTAKLGRLEAPTVDRSFRSGPHQFVEENCCHQIDSGSQGSGRGMNSLASLKWLPSPHQELLQCSPNRHSCKSTAVSTKIRGDQKETSPKVQLPGSTCGGWGVGKGCQTTVAVKEALFRLGIHLGTSQPFVSDSSP